MGNVKVDGADSAMDLKDARRIAALINRLDETRHELNSLRYHPAGRVVKLHRSRGNGLGRERGIRA